MMINLLRVNSDAYTLVLRLGACALLLAATAFGENWPQWRGPHSNGTAPSARDLPVTWSKTENIRWSTRLPSWSGSTPVIWADAIFVLSAEEGFPRKQGIPAPGGIFLLNINRADGSIRWRVRVDDQNKVDMKQNSSSPSPVTDGRHVWSMTGNGAFTCLTTKGEIVWKRNLQEEYGKFGLFTTYASTPLLHGDRLYVQVIHGFRTSEPSYVMAVDKLTGKNVWRVQRRPDPEAVKEALDTYSTPQIVMVGGKPHLATLGGDVVIGQNPDTGVELWRIGGFNPTKNPANRTISSMVVNDGVIYAVGDRGRLHIAFRPEIKKDLSGSELWTSVLAGDIPTATTDGVYLYVLHDRGLVTCIEMATGKAVYERQRIAPATYSASPLLADGKLYFINDDGVTTVIKAGPQFEVLGTNNLDAFTLSSPVAVDNELFIRTADALYCIRKTSASPKEIANE